MNTEGQNNDILVAPIPIEPITGNDTTTIGTDNSSKIIEIDSDSHNINRFSGSSTETIIPVTSATESGKEDALSRALSITKRLGESSIVWLVLWFVLNVSVTLSNKALFQFSGFTFPTTVSLFHMISSSIFSRITIKVSKTPVRVLKDRKEHITMFLFSILFCSNILSGNIGLRYVPVSLVQCVRSTIPGVTMFLSLLILDKKYSINHYLTVFLVVIGVLIATATTVEFHPTGFLFTVLVCFLSSLKSVMTNKFLVSKGLKLHPFDLLNRMSTFSILHLGLTSVCTGEFANAVAWFADNASSKFLFVLFLNAFMAFFLNVCNFFFTKLTSALTVTIVGNVKHVVTILLSIIIFRNKVSLLNAVGITTTVIGAGLYSVVEYKEKVKAAQKKPVVSSV